MQKILFYIRKYLLHYLKRNNININKMNAYKYYCEKCSYGTNIKYSLEQHNESELHKTGQRKKREKKDQKIYSCEECDYKVERKSSYISHKLNNHSTKEDRESSFKYYCKICNFGVFTLSSFNQHNESIKHIGLCHIACDKINKDNIITI